MLASHASAASAVMPMDRNDALEFHGSNDDPDDDATVLGSSLHRRNLNQRPVELLRENIRAYNMSGDDVTFDSYYYPGGVGINELFYSKLDLSNSDNLISNNLGGTGPQLSDSPWIEMRNVTVLRNEIVNMRVFNTTVYEPSQPLNNRYLNSMMQVNLRNIPIPGEPYANFFESVEGDAALGNLGMDFASSASNNVNLFFQFESAETGQPIELEEFYISFFDFDQDWADDVKGYAREVLMVSDFTTAWVSNTTELEVRFSKKENFKIPIRDVTAWDNTNNVPGSYALDPRDGVILRSTKHGTGVARHPKLDWAICQGACAQDPVCSTAALTRFPQRWNGCGNSAGWPNPPNYGTPVDANWEPYYLNGRPVNCYQDCPRTSVSYDDGNPTDPLTLTKQQEDRSVTFLFRNRANFSLIYRNEIGSHALNNTNNDLYDSSGNGPNLNRIATNGRNFLLSGTSELAAGIDPPSPPPPSPPPPSPAPPRVPR